MNTLPQSEFTNIKNLDLSAKKILVGWQKLFFIGIFSIILVSSYIAFIETLFSLIIIFNILSFWNNSYRFLLHLIGIKIYNHKAHTAISISQNNLPIFTILVPLFNESAVIANLIKSLNKLNYPKAKLQILLILEEEDKHTLQTIDEIGLSDHFTKIIVPKSYPQTKAKACNYAMNSAIGDYTCIFDAEDRPDPNQLHIVLDSFNKLPNTYVCIQCRLYFYNAHENLLTRFFEIEYQLLFNTILPAATHFNYTIPLGGSSNYFKTSFLKKIGYWDIYNVTEDADLGLRIGLAGFRTQVIMSYTSEESPINLKAWTKQRTRWFKGYFHTFLIYFRYPHEIFKSFKPANIIFFIHIIFLNPLLMLISPFALIISIVVLNSNLESFQSLLFKIITSINLISGLIYILFSAYLITKLSGKKCLHYIWLLFPAYFLIHIYSVIVAIYKLIKEPHKWDKTDHGITKFNN